MEIVVAHYKEDLSWLSKTQYPATVYNKGEISSPGWIDLENIGRESHSYFHHIISRYDSLATWTVFTQGNPFDHCTGFLDEIHEEAWFRQYGISWVTNSEIEHLERLNLEWVQKEAIPHRICRTVGALFKVHRDCIRIREKSFYEMLYQLHYTVPRMPWIMESIWPFVFHDENSPPLIPRSIWENEN